VAAIVLASVPVVWIDGEQVRGTSKGTRRVGEEKCRQADPGKQMSPAAWHG
jgi:hypothetical protein